MREWKTFNKAYGPARRSNTMGSHEPKVAVRLNFASLVWLAICQVLNIRLWLVVSKWFRADARTLSLWTTLLKALLWFLKAMSSIIILTHPILSNFQSKNKTKPNKVESQKDLLIPQIFIKYQQYTKWNQKDSNELGLFGD